MSTRLVRRAANLSGVRVVIARCEVDYAGRLTAHLPMAPRLILVKMDGSVSIHADDRAYKPLNWMSAPCTLTITVPRPGRRGGAVGSSAPVEALWLVTGHNGETLKITIAETLDDHEYELGPDPGLEKDGVEAHLQALLADNPGVFGKGFRLVTREYPTAIGPVDLLLRDGSGGYVAVEVKRRGEIDGVEQLTRYVELMNRDPLLSPVSGVFAAQQIKHQAAVLAKDRGLSCLTVDYDALRGMDNPEDRLF